MCVYVWSVNKSYPYLTLGLYKRFIYIDGLPKDRWTGPNWCVHTIHIHHLFFYLLEDSGSIFFHIIFFYLLVTSIVRATSAVKHSNRFLRCFCSLFKSQSTHLLHRTSTSTYVEKKPSRNICIVYHIYTYIILYILFTSKK